MPKYPEINVALVGEDGNAFAILGRVLSALRNGKVPKSEQDAFRAEATSGDYNHLLQTVKEWVEIEDGDYCDVCGDPNCTGECDNYYCERCGDRTCDGECEFDEY